MNEMVISAGALLEEQIPETLEGEPTAVDVTNVTEDAKAELQRLKRELESARELSLDPLARSEVVIKARQDSSDLEFHHPTANGRDRSPESKARSRRGPGGGG